MIVEQLKGDLLQARKDRDEVKSGVLRVLLGEIELVQCRMGVTPPDDKIFPMIRKMVESNTICMDGIYSDATHSVGDNHTWHKLNTENEILQKYLPKQLSIEEIKRKMPSEISNEAVASGVDGKLMGLAMTFFKRSGLSVNGNDVKAALEDIKCGR